jgi:hypothetical protein
MLEGDSSASGRRTTRTAEWIGGQVTDALSLGRSATSPDSRPLHGAFGPDYTGRIRAMGIRDQPTAPRSSWQNGHVERPIESISRDALDHRIVFAEAHLRSFLKAYASYDNE